VRVYDRGMEFRQPTTFGEHQLSYRSGDIVIPRVEAAEPLSLELADFARAVRTGATPRSHATLGYDIVATVEAAEASLRRGGEPVTVRPIVSLAQAS
jgi:predicted dehydrogenase